MRSAMVGFSVGVVLVNARIGACRYNRRGCEKMPAGAKMFWE
jgi:hypothetical protein